MDQEPNPSGLGTHEQLDEFDAWMDDFGTNDDEVPTEEVSQELLKDISREVDDTQLQKSYLKSDIVWESRKEDLALQFPKKPAPVYHSCQRNPKAPPVTLLNQDLFYLKYGNSGPKKYTLSLHKYHAVPFPEYDTEERTLRWVGKRIRSVLEMVKKYNKDVKYGYVDPSPTNVDVEYLAFYEEYIEDRLKHRDQMRRWGMYLNGRPLESRKDRPE
ncbi:hypothetical protein Tco_0156381 [Tanacetum coccineum]